MNKWLSEVPTTPLRIVTTILLVWIVVLTWLVVCLVGTKPTPDGMGEVFIFLGVSLGLDIGQFFLKRKTFQHAPPNGPDIEDAKAALGTDGAMAEATRNTAPAPLPAEEPVDPAAITQKLPVVRRDD